VGVIDVTVKRGVRVSRGARGFALGAVFVPKAFKAKGYELSFALKQLLGKRHLICKVLQRNDATFLHEEDSSRPYLG
jgi:hypothetical protein